MRKVLVASLATLVFGACNCDQAPPSVETFCQLEVASEKQLDFGAACPKPENPAYEVELPKFTVKLHNGGTAPCNSITFGLDAEGAKAFAFDATSVPKTLGVGADAEVVVTFQPTGSGTFVGDLTVKGDKPEDGDKTVLKLLGEGKGFDPVPMYSMSCSGQINFAEGCTPSAGTPKVTFITTPVNGMTEATLTLRNGGCPTLKISEIAVTNLQSGTAFALAEGQPTAITVLGGSPTAAAGVIKIRFIPTAEDAFDGRLTFKTNDPAAETVTIDLVGDGSGANLVLTTANDCGSSAKGLCCNYSTLPSALSQPCSGKFTLRNSGEFELTVTKITLDDPTGMFALADTSALVGKTIPGTTAGGNELVDALSVSYTPKALLNNNTATLTIESTGGTAMADLRGGSPPTLVVDTESCKPACTTNSLNFHLLLGSTDDKQYADITFLNPKKYNEQLNLTLKDLPVRDYNDPTKPSARFKVLTDATAVKDNCSAEAKAFTANTVIAPNASFVGCIEFTASDSGGSAIGNLHVFSDDPAFPEPNGFGPYVLRAKSECKTEPKATISVVETDNGNACPCTQPCCAAPPCTGMDECSGTPFPPGSVVVSGEGSYVEVNDFDLVGNCAAQNPPVRQPVSEYEWSIVSAPQGTTITPSGRGTSKTTKVSYSGTQNTPIVLGLKVYDSTGRVSRQTANLAVRPKTTP